MIGDKKLLVGDFVITRSAQGTVRAENNEFKPQEEELARVQRLLLALVDEVINLREMIKEEVHRRKVVEKLGEQGFLPGDRS